MLLWVDIQMKPNWVIECISLSSLEVVDPGLYIGLAKKFVRVFRPILPKTRMNFLANAIL